MAYKQNPGRGPMMKTGKGIPSALLKVDPTDPKEKRSVPKGATFGPTKTSKDEYGATVYSTDYSKKGTPIASGKDLGPDFKPTKEQTKRANRQRAMGGFTGSESGTIKNKIYSGKATDVKSSFGEDKISQKTFTPPKLSRIDQIKIKRFDKEVKREEIAELKSEKRAERIRKVKEANPNRKPLSPGQLEAQAKRNKKNKRARKRAKFWGNISSALTPSGRSGFKPGCFTD